jgi:hypothetical protein
LKILYDLLLYREFVAVQPPEEAVPPGAKSSGLNRNSG